MTLIRPPVMPMATNMSHVVQLVLLLAQFVATLSRRLLEISDTGYIASNFYGQ
jgi:hypothetical protein